MGPEDFDYALPPERIAQAPAPRRADARLLVLADPPIDTHVHALIEHMPKGALVVVNASRVVPARLHVQRGGDPTRVHELLVCDPAPGQGPGARILGWLRGASRIKPGDVLSVGDLRLRLVGPSPNDSRARELDVETGDVLDTLHAHGAIPLPPYIQRAAGSDDALRYQTVYAGPEGSVAAPTAGLHLEPEILARLDVVPLVLHVGPGTFLPMQAEDVADHRVAPERVEVPAAAATRILEAQAQGRPIVAVGTTVTRALEGLALHGGVRPFSGTIDLVVRPGHRFAVVTHLLTNFHLPRSSLLMLVSSFGGHARVMAAYRHAVAAGYRFYSYGDCMLLPRADAPCP